MNKLLFDQLINDMNESQLLEVLESYASATPDGNDKRILEDWIRRFPQFSQELIDFAANRDLRTFSVQPEIDEYEEARFLKRSWEAFERMRGRKPRPAIASLIHLAEQRSLRVTDFAAKLGISMSLLIYLEKRKLDFMTIPKRMIRKIADVLEVSQESVIAFLSQGPGFAPNANYKASAKPMTVPPKSFIEAVKQDQELTHEQKIDLIRMAEE